MAKITRIKQLLFGSNAGTDQIGVFGSKFTGVPDTTTDPDEVQSLGNFLTGWYEAVISGNSPCIEDMNALFFLVFYQIAYGLQTGVPEWNVDTVYFIGSFVSSGSLIYVSITDNNTGNLITDITNWKLYGAGGIRTVTSNDSATAADDMIIGNPTSGSFIETLPAVASTPVGKEITVKNIATNANTVTVKGNSSELLDLANTFVLNSGNGILESATFKNTGTLWYIK